MGICIQSREDDVDQQNKRKQKQQNKKIQTQIESVDVVKMKLKQARDKIKTFIHKKNTDLSKIEEQIQQKIPHFKETGNKKQIIPLLKAKKSLQEIIENGQVRLKLVNEKLSEVQMQQLNKQTVEVLEQSNKYIQTIQQQLEDKDWRAVLDQAQTKYELEWPDDREEIEEDPEFQQMWNQLGGNKISAKKTVQRKKVDVEVKVNTEENRNKMLA